MLTALKEDAGYEAETYAETRAGTGEPKAREASADTTDELPRFVGKDGHDWPASKPRSSAATLPWIRPRHRTPWRELARNALAWIATIMIVGGIIWGAAQMLNWGRHIPPPNAPASPPGPGLIP